EAVYQHGDQIGSMRMLTYDGASVGRQAVYTAFGERVWSDGSIGATRYQYAGAWGYQTFPEHTGQPGDEIPFIHVGHRWYDPATGRFLQRDPIGIRGGLNLYSFVKNTPAMALDPDGLTTFLIHWKEGGGRGVGHTAVYSSETGAYLSFVPCCSIFGSPSFPDRTLFDDYGKYGLPTDMWVLDGLNENGIRDVADKYNGEFWQPHRNCITATMEALNNAGVPVNTIPPLPPKVREELNRVSNLMGGRKAF
ncbi:MAG: hypothetical protein DCC65_13565, partial [Planctomycetota bacterium]